MLLLHVILRHPWPDTNAPGTLKEVYMFQEQVEPGEPSIRARELLSYSFFPTGIVGGK